MTDAPERILAGVAEGRRRAIEEAKARGALTRQVVLQHASDDEARGRPARGRAGRIARKLRGLVRERQVRNILGNAASVADSTGHTQLHQHEDAA